MCFGALFMLFHFSAPFNSIIVLNSVRLVIIVVWQIVSPRHSLNGRCLLPYVCVCVHDGWCLSECTCLCAISTLYSMGFSYLFDAVLMMAHCEWASSLSIPQPPIPSLFSSLPPLPSSCAPIFLSFSFHFPLSIRLSFNLIVCLICFCCLTTLCSWCLIFIKCENDAHISSNPTKALRLGHCSCVAVCVRVACIHTIDISINVFNVESITFNFGKCRRESIWISIDFYR